MTPASKMDFKKIQDAIRSLGRADQRTHQTTKVGDNPKNVANVLTLIEDLCAVIRQQEGLPLVDDEGNETTHGAEGGVLLTFGR